jgi:hypothetical protein
MQSSHDTQLMQLARKRVDFRRHLIVYLVVNAVLWTMWLVTGKGYIWPVWPMAGWGVGVILHFLFDYQSSKLFSEEEELKKLKRKMEKHGHITG